MNVAGLFIHYLTDRSQRQAFLETRRCIEGRMKLETENQRQVKGLEVYVVLRFQYPLSINKLVLIRTIERTYLVCVNLV